MGACASAELDFKDSGDAAAFANDFILGESCGTGSTAQVYKAQAKNPRMTNDQKEIAVKVINKADFDEAQQKTILREATILACLSRRKKGKGLPGNNIIRCYAFYNQSPEKAYLVLDFIDGGDLFDRLSERKGVYVEWDARELAKNVLEALVQLNRAGVAHRDLKMASLMLRKGAADGEVVMMDFGMASVVKHPETEKMLTQCGTPEYVAPEVLDCAMNGGYIGHKADIWSTGVILYTVISGQRPFRLTEAEESVAAAKTAAAKNSDAFMTDEDLALAEERDLDDILFTKIRAGKVAFHPAIWGKVSPGATSLLRRMFLLDASARPSAEECLASSWFAPDYRDECMVRRRAVKRKTKKKQEVNEQQEKGGREPLSNLTALKAADIPESTPRKPETITATETVTDRPVVRTSKKTKAKPVLSSMKNKGDLTGRQAALMYNKYGPGYKYAKHSGRGTSPASSVASSSYSTSTRGSRSSRSETQRKKRSSFDYNTDLAKSAAAARSPLR